MSSTPEQRPSGRTVARDVITFVGGWAMLIYQMLFVDPGQVNETFLWIAAAMVGVPSAAEGVARILSGTPSPSPLPPPPASSSSSPS